MRSQEEVERDLRVEFGAEICEALYRIEPRGTPSLSLGSFIDGKAVAEEVMGEGVGRHASLPKELGPFGIARCAIPVEWFLVAPAGFGCYDPLPAR